MRSPARRFRRAGEAIMIVPLLLSGLALILAYAGSRRRLSAGQLLLVALFFGAGVGLVLFPSLATAAAQALNVGRGADLLLYFAVLSGVMVTANFYFRLKQNERILIEIVRQLALLSPLLPERPPEEKC
jgi:small membrane protein